MRILPKLICLLGLFLPMALCAADAVTVTDHSIVGFKNAGEAKPKTIIIKLEVEYVLTSKPKAVLLFVIDRDAEMNFVLADQKEVMGEKKKRKIEVVARLENFSRDTLRGILILQDPDTAVGSAPLAKTGISLDVKKFKNG